MTTESNEKAQKVIVGDTNRDHHPTIYTTGRFGCWCHCSCGWKSITMTTNVGAHNEFGRHLVDVTNQANTPDPFQQVSDFSTDDEPMGRVTLHPARPDDSEHW